MSLLMDALRKAEQQKQQGTAIRTAPTGGTDAGTMSLEPLPDRTSSSKPVSETSAPADGISRRLPELPKRLEELDDQFFTTDPALQKSIRALTATKASGGEPTPSPVKPITSTSRDAAQNVFAAKQPVSTVGHGFAISVSIATLIAIAAIGSYFYWQMQPKGGVAVGQGIAVQQAPVAQQPAPVAQVVPAAPAITSAATPVATPPVTTQQPAGTSRKADIATPRTAAAQTTKPTQAALQPAPEHPDSVIRVSTKQKKTDGTMEAAHAAFSRGETDLARSIWLKTLQSDSRNINALHGLAAISQQEGKPEQAAMLYRRVLEVDPRDAVAYAGLLSLSATSDVRQTESQLKGLLAEQPNSAHLHFALGNLYLGDSRWSEAQQSFFKAHVAAPENPDYLYNLAVSLDHLRQASLAAQYYGRALDAARTQTAAFDPAKVEERLRTLRNEQQR